MSFGRRLEIDSASFASSFLQKYNKLRQDERHCDFTIKAEDETHRVHRTVLIVSSEYFRAMLEHDTQENDQGFVNMKGVDPSAVAKAIEFMYTGETFVDDREIAGLMHVAFLMQLDVLCEGIEKFLADGMSKESFYAAKKFADVYECKGLANKCKEFALQNFNAIANIDDFAELEENYVLALISSPDTKASEVRKYKAFKKWIDKVESNRSNSYFRMLSAIKVNSLLPSFRRYILENEPMLYKSAECMQILTVSLFEAFKVPSCDFDADHQNAVAAFSPCTGTLTAYTAEDDSWYELCKMDVTIKNSSFCIVALDDIILALKGDRKVFCLKHFDAASVTWTEMKSMLHSHGTHPPVVVHNKCVYVVGNSDSENMTSEMFDLANNVWTQVAVTQQCRSRKKFSLCSSESAILLIGGNAQQNTSYGQPIASSDCDRLDISDASWKPVSPMTRARLSPSSAYNNGKIYVAGGHRYEDRGARQPIWETVTEVYNVSANTWTSIANFPTLNEGVSSVFVMDVFYVFGSSRIFQYDAGINIWTEKNKNTPKRISPPSGLAPIAY